MTDIPEWVNSRHPQNRKPEIKKDADDGVGMVIILITLMAAMGIAGSIEHGTLW